MSISHYNTNKLKSKEKQFQMSKIIVFNKRWRHYIMRRKTITKSMSLLLSLILTILVIPLSQITVFAATSEDYQYSINRKDNTAELTNYKGSETELVIPSEIDGHRVTSIRDAFSACNSVQKVTIPASIKSISEGAFSNCRSLKEVIIEEGTQSIEYQAFYFCNALEKINFPKSLKTIGDEAFSCCTSLGGRLVLDSVESIGSMAFYRCEALESLIVSSNIKNIGNDAFGLCKSIKYISVFGSVTSIGANAFFDCDALENVLITGITESIGDHAFFHCDKLKNIVFIGEVGSIGVLAIPRDTRIHKLGNNITGSVFNSGNTVLLLGGGFLLGAIVTAIGITAIKKRKKEEENA